MRRVSVNCLLIAFAGCASPGAIDHPDDKVGMDEEGAPIDGAFDSFFRPTAHGELGFGEAGFGEPHAATLSPDARFHAWDFELTGDATVRLATDPGEAGWTVDTVMYLYREGERGWGRYLAKNDDTAASLFSALEEPLTEGRYRVLIKGWRRWVSGPFALTGACEGPGCPGAPPVEPPHVDPPVEQCLFGETFVALREDPAFDTLGATEVRHHTRPTPERAAQIVAAVRVAWPEVADLSEALSTVDEDYVNVLELAYRATGDRYVAVEYGAGDNSYGAVFFGDSTEVAATIQDSDLYRCRVERPAPGPEGRGAGQDCDATRRCGAGLQCEGQVEGVGKCVPSARVEGEGDSCSASAACPSDALLCAGLGRDPSFGLCLPTWMRGTFTDEARGAIPDEGELRRELTAYGLATVDMGVRLTATIEHPFPADLQVFLQNPSGTEVEVWDGYDAEADGPTVTLDQEVLGFSGDESVNGAWTLRVVDRAALDEGTLARWSLTVTSRWD